MRGYLADVAERGLRVDGTVRAAERWQAAAERLESKRDELTRRAGERGRDRVSAAILAQERSLTARQGLPGRDWYKHQVYAPGEYTGYAVQHLPGINGSLDKGETATAERYLKLLTDALHKAAAA